jgi:hypothetical protein
MQLGVLHQVASIGTQAGFWAGLLFPAVTAVYWPWWRHWWGWTIVVLDMAIVLALLGSILVLEFGLHPGSTPGHVLAWTEAFALCLVPAVIVWRAVLVFITQRGEGPGAVRCPAGHHAPAGARFCPACGLPMDGGPGAERLAGR